VSSALSVSDAHVATVIRSSLVRSPMFCVVECASYWRCNVSSALSVSDAHVATVSRSSLVRSPMLFLLFMFLGLLLLSDF